ncbi:MAG: PSD1 and planctomycete cytochrome C domain-containing protein, partial [Cyclobacteriaceae bacterium]|nr:PSD1 and planctomycete cytochrome C domain-containing protein [Cyclobacteriaceae bacterium]
MIKKIVLFLIPIVIVVAAIFVFRSDNLNSDLPRKIDYNFHVRPILSDKCFACHGPDESKRKSGLRLDNSETAYAVLKDQPNEYAIIPGKPNHSHLIRRIFSEDSTERMPPPEFNLKLTDREKDIIYKWIEQGAEYKPHWSFVKPEKQDLPQVENKEWIKNAIDYYIVGKLEEIGLKPNEIADKDHLLKRVSFDLTGLPPTPELHEEFINDKSENAYEKIIDKLLSMPQYGEKMAVHWLDVARYADSHGYQDDGLRTMWPWRDWVIHAFNENYPYDKFVTWQLAGDLLPERTKESLLATGFNRNHKITQEGGVIDEEYRIEYVTDRTNTFGKAFLGMTFECAKCHDHKYDPISKTDYYSTFAFFNRVPEKGIFGTIDASFADPPNMKITSDIVKNELNFINLKDSSVDVMVMKDSFNIRKTFVLNRGAYDQPTDEVDFGTPEDILKFDTTLYEKNRLGLAKWLFDENNPLTARVYVNRVWQEIFGRGLVRTSGDFGMQGEFPSHPELLDYLALDFRNNHWDIKYLIKKIVTSATYMQSAVVHEEKYTKDPDNIYFSRYKRMRLSAEEIRDHALASSGLLNPEIGGASVKPYQPEGLWESATSGRGTLQA